jgi:hypothetical protein
VSDSSDLAACVVEADVEAEAEGIRIKRGRGRGLPRHGCAEATEAKHDAGGVDRAAMGYPRNSEVELLLVGAAGGRKWE